jgi:hypothetical protein
MDKQKFTTELVQYATTGCGLLHGAYVFSMESSYVYCPNVPSSPDELRHRRVSDNEIRQIWTSFLERVYDKYSKNEEYRCKLTGEDRTFNWNNGKIAIVVGDKIYVCKSEYIDDDTLRELGFSSNYNLFVPMSNGEAYYEPAADYGCNNCGLIS